MSNAANIQSLFGYVKRTLGYIESTLGYIGSRYLEYFWIFWSVGSGMTYIVFESILEIIKSTLGVFCE